MYICIHIYTRRHVNIVLGTPNPKLKISISNLIQYVESYKLITSRFSFKLMLQKSVAFVSDDK